jgi:hypothetical protein
MHDETATVEAALDALAEAIEGLRSASTMVDQQLEEAADRATRPNSRRAEQQLRIALNAALGAQRSLQRRLHLSREAGVRYGRGPEARSP